LFTGLVEEVGTIDSVREEGEGITFSIRASAVLDGLAIGDSIAIDGACQTVTSLTGSGFTVHAVATTLGRTIFGDYRAGRRVNLERSMALGARLGGHLVQGHVDGIGTVRSIEPQAEMVLVDFTLPPTVADVTVLHGSIALNGVSLTVNALPLEGVAQVSIIPFTWEHTALPDLRENQSVNLEGDLIGKYVQHLLGRASSGGAGGRVSADGGGDFLSARGY
jgi:riboflavin synthase